MVDNSIPTDRISVQLASYQGYEKTTVGKNNTPAIIVKYVRLDGGENQCGKDMTAKYLVGKLSQESKDILKNLKKDDHFVVVKQKEGEFWNLKEFRAADTYVAPVKKQQFQNNHNKSTNNSGGNNNTGIKVGAILHDSVALAGVGATVAQVGRIARELLMLSYKLEEEVNKGMFKVPTFEVEPETDTEEHYTNDREDEVPF